ncbi:hypothetical protein FHW89_004483 [Mucilaginibacter sp. SG564]|nr:hypothetical protein [Mucilaginibacter sp. SG564]
MKKIYKFSPRGHALPKKISPIEEPVLMTLTSLSLKI